MHHHVKSYLDIVGCGRVQTEPKDYGNFMQGLMRGDLSAQAAIRSQESGQSLAWHNDLRPGLWPSKLISQLHHSDHGMGPRTAAMQVKPGRLTSLWKMMGRAGFFSSRNRHITAKHTQKLCLVGQQIYLSVCSRASADAINPDAGSKHQRKKRRRPSVHCESTHPPISPYMLIRRTFTFIRHRINSRHHPDGCLKRPMPQYDPSAYSILLNGGEEKWSEYKRMIARINVHCNWFCSYFINWGEGQTVIWAHLNKTGRDLFPSIINISIQATNTRGPHKSNPLMHEPKGMRFASIYHDAYFQLTFDLILYQDEVRYIFSMHPRSQKYTPPQ